jgi:hypothetical protein
LAGLLRPMLQAALTAGDRSYEFITPRLPPVAGAALYAAKLAGTALAVEGIETLAHSLEGAFT